MRVRARDVSLALDGGKRSSILNEFRARVASFEPVSEAEVLVRLECPSDPSQAMLARITKKSVAELALAAGLELFARVKGVSVR